MNPKYGAQDSFYRGEYVAFATKGYKVRTICRARDGYGRLDGSDQEQGEKGRNERKWMKEQEKNESLHAERCWVDFHRMEVIKSREIFVVF